MTSEEFDANKAPAPRPDDVVFDVDGGDSGSWLIPSRKRPLERREYERRHRRLVKAMVVMVFVILLGNGFGWTLYAETQYNICTERNVRVIASGKALGQLERAAIEDDDAYQSLVWHNYNATISKLPPPPCKGKAFFHDWANR